MTLHPITLLHGDCLTQIPLLKNRSIRAVITSPPYAQQRKKHYPGWDESEYPETMVKILDAIRPKLTKDGSILVNIRSHVKDGAVSDYVLKTRLALREQGWIENEELIWYKPQSEPRGSIYRPRRSFENILWFSMSKDPFVNLKAAGRLSGNIGGFGGAKRKSGIARISDVFIAGVGKNARGVKHPAKFPPTLVEQLVHTFTAEGDGVLDCFAGSGTTLFVSRFMKRRAFGIEIMQKYVDVIRSREAKIGDRAVKLKDIERTARVFEIVSQRFSFDKSRTVNVRDLLNESFDEDAKQRWKVLDA